MPLRRRLIAALAATTLLFAIAAAGVAAWSSWRGFSTVELAEAERDAERAAQALRREAEQLALVTADWSYWDDTLSFVRGTDPDYEQVNLVPDTLAILQVTDIAIIDHQGTPVWTAGYDPDTGEFTDVDPELLAALTPGSELFADDLDHDIAGVYELGHGLALVASQPISDSAGEADVAGTFVMVRDMDAAFLEGLARRVQREVHVQPADPSLPATERTGDAVLSRVPLGGEDGEPLALLTVTTPRTVSAVGLRTIATMALTILVVLMAMGATTVVVTDRIVVRRLLRLRDDSAQIGQRGLGRAREDDQGDELSEVIQAVNSMVGSLERAHQDLELRNAELMELARIRQDLVAVVSHELRTPLTSLQGFATTLHRQGHALDDEQRAHLARRIDVNARRLNRLVGDLLVLSRADEGEVVVLPEDIDLQAVVTEIEEDLALTFDTDVEAGAVAHCDPDHLRRMLVNLLENARKYGGQPILLSARSDGDDVVITVADHGPGIPSEFVPHLFDRFTQASTGNRRTARGVGLGLSIVHTLAISNGGDVSHVPTEVGATFRLRLPAGKRTIAIDGEMDSPAARQG